VEGGDPSIFHVSTESSLHTGSQPGPKAKSITILDEVDAWMTEGGMVTTLVRGTVWDLGSNDNNRKGDHRYHWDGDWDWDRSAER
jgi:hypothetical protein